MSSGDLQPTVSRENSNQIIDSVDDLIHFNFSKHTLTGHTNKVHTGKFLGIMKVVTGSYDRTLKVWDLIQKACNLNSF